MLQKRMGEINARKTEIRGILENDATADLDALEKELRTLDDEGKELERRASVAAGIASGTIPAAQVSATFQQAKPVEFDKRTVLSTPEYRSAFAKILMRQELTDIEERAAGVALTTTATTYVAAGVSADGVNNGGLFIPTDVNLALMQTIGQTSPLFNDANKTSVPGLLKFPYRSTGSGASEVTQGTDNTDGQVQWAELTLSAMEISETIRVTWKLEAMAVDDFISYITQELIDAIQDKVVASLIYGDGTNDTMTGVTIGAADGTYTGDAMDGIEAGLALLAAKRKIGAKIYVSQSIIEEIAFQKDANGNYLYTPINGGGVSSIATYPVAVDPYLTAGDFIIGNMNRYYRMNTNEAVSITRDVSGKKRANDYTAYTIIGGAPQPSCFVYGKKS